MDHIRLQHPKPNIGNLLMILMVSGTRTIPISLGILMGVVWE